MKACLALLVAGALGVTGCDNMQDQPNRDGAADARGPRFAEITRALHSVPHGEPSPGDPFTSGWASAERVTRSPVPFTRDVLLRGQDRFNIYCAVCHGADGYGRGIVVRRGFPPPPSYHEERLRAASDGYLFEVMTRGYGAMLPYADRLTARDRWAIVGYIRALQRSQHASFADVPESARAALRR